jgi:signal transduction histidine kinase
LSPVRSTLRSHLAFIVLGAVLPGALLTGVIVWRTQTANRVVLEHRLVDAARVDAATLDREFNGTVRVLQTLAQSPALDRGDLATFWIEANRGLRTQPGWFAVILLAPDGQQLVHTDIPFGEPLRRATEPESLRQVLATGQPSVGPLAPGQRDPKLRFPIRVPVQRDGALRYVLTAMLEPESLTGVIHSALPETEEWTRAIVDPGFRIAARSRNGEQFVGRPITAAGRERILNPPPVPFEGTSLDGEQLYSAMQRSHYGWTTSVSVPAAVLDGPVKASLLAIVSGTLVLVLGGLLSVLFVSRRVAGDYSVALQRAEEASRAKDQFLAALGHELRNPLAPALTALELMKLKGGTSLQRERDVIERQISHMKRLVDDLLDVSRLTRGKVDLVAHRFELRVAVDRALDMARPLLTAQQHELRLDVPATGLLLDADEDRIVQVLVNLLTNAARYTPPHGHISVTAQTSNRTVTIACEDDGPGVPAAVVPTIFEPFAQGPRTLDRQEGGLGLGLALARSLTELHGGALAHTPVVPHGSRFTVTLPLAAGAASPKPRLAAATAVPFASRRVLLVEDNVDGRDMMKTALAAAGHEVLVAGDGQTALRIITKATPDVAVLDIGLPGMDGYELARQLRARFASIRLIALTGYGQASDTEAARDAGFDAHCTKPVTVAALLERIQSAACEL